jgi:predicted metal-dependent phosphoesterase TrpH
MRNEAWSAADLHIHTTASDGVATPAQVVDWVCDRTDLRVIAIADHNTNVGAIEAARMVHERGLPLEVIVAQEVESSDGHIIGLWTPEVIAPSMTATDTVAAIHAQGGLAIAAHPFAPRLWSHAGLDRGRRSVYGSVDYDAMEVANSTPLLFVANFVAQLYQHRNSDRFACTGGSDAHILTVIGTSRTYFPGETAEDLRSAIEDKLTRVSRPGFSLARQMRYARNVPDIRARDRERKAREVEAGIREPKVERRTRSEKRDAKAERRKNTA